MYCARYVGMMYSGKGITVVRSTCYSGKVYRETTVTYNAVSFLFGCLQGCGMYSFRKGTYMRCATYLRKHMYNTKPDQEYHTAESGLTHMIFNECFNNAPY
jgi:hypothetical protein